MAISWPEGWDAERFREMSHTLSHEVFICKGLYDRLRVTFDVQGYDNESRMTIGRIQFEGIDDVNERLKRIGDFHEDYLDFEDISPLFVASGCIPVDDEWPGFAHMSTFEIGDYVRAFEAILNCNLSDSDKDIVLTNLKKPDFSKKIGSIAIERTKVLAYMGVYEPVEGWRSKDEVQPVPQFVTMRDICNMLRASRSNVASKMQNGPRPIEEGGGSRGRTWLYADIKDHLLAAFPDKANRLP